jgi:hypothetical protein
MAKVQMLARWSEIAVKRDQTDPGDDELKRLLGSEEPETGMYRTEIVHEYGPLTFDLEDVKRYNRAKERGHTTVHFNDGDTVVLKIPYWEFLEIDIQYSGKQISDFLPIDYIDPEEEDIEDENNDDLEL